MSESTTEDLVKNSLRAKNVKLWLPPYSDELGDPNQEALDGIIQEISQDIKISQDLVSNCVANLRSYSVERLKKKKQNIVTLKIKCSAKPNPEKVEVQLSISGDELKEIAIQKLEITDEVKLICKGRVIEGAYSLQSQFIRDNSVILCLIIKASDRKESKEVEKALNEVKRARRGAELLAKAGADDNDESESYGFEIEDQMGQALDMPAEEKRSLSIALGLHEKGRTILKRKEYELALLLLLEADKEFNECRSEILSRVDNYAVLCLDIVWCYVCSKNISALPDARIRLKKCETAFEKSYGESLQRLLSIKGSSGNEISLFVRLYVLQAIVNYHDGKYQECNALLEKAQGYAKMVVVDQNQVTELMSLGLSARESRRALRANMMNVTLASQWAFKQREEHKETKKREKERKRIKKLQKEFGPCANGDPVNIDSYDQLVNQMGFEPDLVMEALKQADNEVSMAIEIIHNNPEQLRLAAEENKNERKTKVKKSAVQQLKSMGYDETTVKACLDHFSGSIDKALEYLTEEKGEIPADWIQALQESMNSAGPSTKYTDEERAMMHDVAQDVSQREDEYLDNTLEEELSMIEQYKIMITSVTQQ